jgi:hypothetical protein
MDAIDDPKNIKVGDVLNQLANDLDCKMDATPDNRILDILKKVVKNFKDGSESWAKYKSNVLNSSKNIKMPKSVIIDNSKQNNNSSNIPQEMTNLSSDTLDKLSKVCTDGKTIKEIQKQLSQLGVTQLNGKSVYKYLKKDLCDVLNNLQLNTNIQSDYESKYEPVEDKPVEDIKYQPLNPVNTSNRDFSFDPSKCKLYTKDQILAFVKKNGWNPTTKEKANKSNLCDYVLKMISSENPKEIEYRSPVRPAAAEDIKYQPLNPVNTSDKDFSFDPSKCKLYTKDQILAFVKKNGWNPTTKEKANKSNLCDYVLKMISSENPKEIEYRSPVRPVVADIIITPSFDPSKCKSYTRDKIQAYIDHNIKENGWSVPTTKDKKNKDNLCDYVLRMTSKSQSTNQPESIIPVSSPDGLENCDTSRTLTIKSIQDYSKEIAKKYGIDIIRIPGAPYPSTKATKSDWCEWLNKVIEHVRNGDPVSIFSGKSLSPKKQLSPKNCAQQNEWISDEQFAEDMDCGDQVCDVNRKECVDEKQASVKGLNSIDVTLRNGKIITIVGQENYLNNIKKKLKSQPCNTKTSGTTEDLLADIRCADSNQVCNLTDKQCVDLNSVGQGLSKTTYLGRDIVGKSSDIQSWKKLMNQDDEVKVPVAKRISSPKPSKPKSIIRIEVPQELPREQLQPSQPKPSNLKSSLKKSRINPLSYSEEDEKKISSAARRALDEEYDIEEEKYPSSYKMNTKPKLAYRTLPKNKPEIKEEEPVSMIATLRKRLKDIKGDNRESPVILTSISDNDRLRQAIKVCTGIAS